MKNKSFIIIIFFLVQFSLHDCYAVEPNEILKDPKQEERARYISKNIRNLEVSENQRHVL